MCTFSAGEDYKGQSSTCTYPAGAEAGDTQCLSIPIIDDDICDGDVFFTVSLTTFDPLVRIISGQDSLEVQIVDNDCMLSLTIFINNITCLCLLLGPQVRFQLSEYSVSESEGSVEVCVELVGGPLSSKIDVQVQTQSATALGKCPNVYTCLSVSTRFCKSTYSTAN